MNSAKNPKPDNKEAGRVTLPLAQSPAAAFMKNYFRSGVRLKY